jgi:alkylhydroperoxidase family enzyme
MARIPLIHRRTLKVRILEAYSRRTYGKVPEPGLVALHNPRVLTTMLKTEASAAKWNRLDPTLGALAIMAAAAEIGCSWCLDFGYWTSHNDGVDPRKLEDVPLRHTSEIYTDLEHRVMEYSVAMTATPPTVNDEQVATLRAELGDAALVELTALVSLENQRSRTNAAMGLTSQGFKEQCEVRPVARIASA